MAITLTATEAKVTLLALLDKVAAGDEVEITKHGRLVARLIPARDAQGLKGLFADVVVSSADDDELFTTGSLWEHG